MIIAGLTGGIASGKSTVADIMRNAGAVIIDADRIAREVVAPTMPAWKEIRALFGDEILGPDNQIDRDALGKIVFEDPELRRRLETIIHPRVRAHIDTQLQSTAQTSPNAVVIMDIPLLFETERTDGFSEIIAVYTPETIQLKRLMQRNGFNRQEAEARIRSQMPLSEKVKRATYIIDNSGSLAATKRQTMAVYRKLADRARR